ncbi:hypothetical protein [Pedobacter antarcticus]|uniref:hypothetical protein n=1 Tax=Pedobacter antarcticus TaxID=34086 RepID=UPI00292E6B84|nr:hypothetical protein [Pedobacter antarcticus]
MNTKILSLLVYAGITLFSADRLYAQKTDPDLDYNVWMNQPVIVDGNSREWHEPLNNFNSDTKLAFALGNDDKNLYLVVESLDEVTTGKVIRGGLTLNINTSGKKKDGIKINFLGVSQPPAPHGESRDSVSQHLPASGSHVRDSGVKVISVSGFKQIPDGTLIIPNDAGIQVAAAFNERREYICELAIPLAQLSLTGKEAKGIAYQIKINNAGNTERHREGGQGSENSIGRGKDGGMRGGGGHGGSGMGGMHGAGGMGRERNSEGNAENSKSADFWIKYGLARPV